MINGFASLRSAGRLVLRMSGRYPPTVEKGTSASAIPPSGSLTNRSVIGSPSEGSGEVAGVGLCACAAAVLANSRAQQAAVIDRGTVLSQICELSGDFFGTELGDLHQSLAGFDVADRRVRHGRQPLRQC